MSGYARSGDTPKGSPDRGDAFLQKPFSSRELARKVREVLDSA